MEQILKYVWIFNTIYKAGKRGITLKELNEKWQNHTDLSCGKELLRPTFDRWKRSLEEIFSVIIECDYHNGYRYYISNVEELERGGVSRWLLDTYATASAITNHKRLRNRIVVSEVPSSYKHLEKIFDAMQEKKTVKISYCRFDQEKARTFEVDPYCVKQFKLRWCLLAHNSYSQNNNLRIYSLDRIEKLSITENTFQLPKDFDAHGFFADYFGIVADDSVPMERIVIRADAYNKHYLSTLPLHHSQQLIHDAGDYADFELRLRPTYDFIMELLSRGNFIQVIEPQSLRKTMQDWIKDMGNLYKK